MGKLEILSKFSFFTKSSESFRTEVLEVAQPARLPAGSFYVREGDMCSNLALVGDGVIRVFKVGETGREITLYNVYSGEVCLLNVSCLLSGLPSPASARVESDVEALVVPAPVFQKWMATSATVREYIFGVVASRFAAVTSLIEEVAFRKMDQRLSAYLAQRFGSDGSAQRELTITHEQIAADLGTAREVVSRLLKELERQNVVRLQRGRIILESADGLREGMVE